MHLQRLNQMYFYAFQHDQMHYDDDKFVRHDQDDKIHKNDLNQAKIEIYLRRVFVILQYYANMNRLSLYLM